MRKLVQGMLSLAAVVAVSGTARTAAAMPVPVSQFQGALVGNVFYGPISLSQGLDPTQVTVDTSSGQAVLVFNGSSPVASGSSPVVVSFTEAISAQNADITAAGLSFLGGVNGASAGPVISLTETLSRGGALLSGGVFSVAGTNGPMGYQGFGTTAILNTDVTSLNAQIVITLNPQLLLRGGSVGIDSVSLSFGAVPLPVPEPTGFVLTGVGLLGLVGYGARHRRRRS